MSHLRADRILKQMGWEKAPLRPLSGGITNENYALEKEGTTYVLRLCGNDTEVLGINRNHEIESSQIAAQLGIGPQILKRIESENAFIVQFIEGQTLTPELACEPERMKRIAKVLKIFHEGPLLPGPFRVFEIIRAYFEESLKRGVEFPPTLPTALNRAKEIEKGLSLSSRTPCHNDLLAGNFIDDGKKIWVLDWEYAGNGDRFFDLGNFAVNQNLDSSQKDFLLEAYFGEVRSQDRAQLELMTLISDLRESLWSFLQTRLSKIEFDYQHYAHHHLERFLSRTSQNEFHQWIKEANKKEA